MIGRVARAIGSESGDGINAVPTLLRCGTGADVSKYSMVGGTVPAAARRDAAEEGVDSG
jgi:hypothetical protein